MERALAVEINPILTISLHTSPRRLSGFILCSTHVSLSPSSRHLLISITTRDSRGRSTACAAPRTRRAPTRPYVERGQRDAETINSTYPPPNSLQLLYCIVRPSSAAQLLRSSFQHRSHPCHRVSPQGRHSQKPMPSYRPPHDTSRDPRLDHSPRRLQHRHAAAACRRTRYTGKLSNLRASAELPPPLISTLPTPRHSASPQRRHSQKPVPHHRLARLARLADLTHPSHLAHLARARASFDGSSYIPPPHTTRREISHPTASSIRSTRSAPTARPPYPACGHELTASAPVRTVDACARAELRR